MSEKERLEELLTIARTINWAAETRPPWLVSTQAEPAAQARYYRFLYELARKMKPKVSIEIGTYCGGSAAHLAAGNPDGLVITVDHNPDAKVQAGRLGLSNLRAYTSDSMAFAREMPRLLEGKPAELLYIDGNHTFNQAYGEYTAYRPHVADGGILIFDDLALSMAGREMEVFWGYVLDDKARLDGLHHTGFGVAVKRSGLPVPPWDSVSAAAHARIKDNARTARAEA